MTKKNDSGISVSLMQIGILFCVCLVTSNLLGTKIFRVTDDIALPCAVLVFPISYILNDVITEVWGFKRARQIIWTGFAMNFIVVAFGGIAALMPAVAPGADTAFCEIFGFAPQVTVASFLAFIIGSLMNAYVMTRMKLADEGKSGYVWRFSLRAILSTIIGEGLDSLIFIPLAFYVFPMIFGGNQLPLPVMLTMMASQVAVKTLYEIIVLPVTLKVVKYVKRHQ